MRFVDQVARPLGIALAILFVNVAIYSQPPSPSLPPIIVKMEQNSRGFWDYLLIFTQVATLVGSRVDLKRSLVLSSVCP
jgi:hypothetical protein